MSVLECSTAGDKRFSALCAEVSLWGRKQTIEEWYQLSKLFGDRRPNTWQEVKKLSKFMKPTACLINGTILDTRFLTPWYKYLWFEYLENNPKLVEYAATFDDYHDKFKGKSVNCQADVIRQYIKEGRKSVLLDCSELLSIILGE